MRKASVKRVAVSLSMLAKVVAGDGSVPTTGNGPWLDPNGGQAPNGETPPASGVGPALDPNGGR